jgi:hypothetical protein
MCIIIVLLIWTRCLMGLNRGSMGLQPCPVCHVPKDQLHDCTKSWPYRTGLETQKLVADARALNKAWGEEILKANGIQPVDVSYFFLIKKKKKLDIHFKNTFMTVAWSDHTKSYHIIACITTHIGWAENISFQWYLDISKHLGVACWRSSIKGNFFSSLLI